METQLYMVSTCSTSTCFPYICVEAARLTDRTSIVLLVHKRANKQIKNKDDKTARECIYEAEKGSLKLSDFEDLLELYDDPGVSFPRLHNSDSFLIFFP